MNFLGDIVESAVRGGAVKQAVKGIKSGAVQAVKGLKKKSGQAVVRTRRNCGIPTASDACLKVIFWPAPI